MVTKPRGRYVMEPSSNLLGVVVGSMKVLAECGHEVWIAPTGHQVLADHPDLERICLDCHLRRPLADSQIRWSVAQELELEREVGTDAALEVFTWARRHGGKRGLDGGDRK